MDRRKVTRFKIDLPVAYRAHGRTELGSAYDLSTDGCLLQTTNNSLSVGHTVRVVFRSHPPIEGTVVWAKHRNAGVHFRRPLAWPTLQRLMDEGAKMAANEGYLYNGSILNGISVVVAMHGQAGPIVSRMLVPFVWAALGLFTAILLIAA